MAETTVVHLLRHGEVHNPDDVLYGRLPGYHLSENGRQMAETVAKAVAGRDVTALFCSPLERAQETAAPLAATFHLDVTIDDRLHRGREHLRGPRRRPGRRRSSATRATTATCGTRSARPGASRTPTIVSADERPRSTTRADAARGHEAIMVSHQLPIWTIRLAAEGRRGCRTTPAAGSAALASLTSFTFEGDRLVSVGYSEPAAALVKRPTVAGRLTPPVE